MHLLKSYRIDKIFSFYLSNNRTSIKVSEAVILKENLVVAKLISIEAILSFGSFLVKVENVMIEKWDMIRN